MATPLDSNLYPPIIATYMPAFIRTEDCPVTFSLSSYNSFDDFDGAEVSLRYQTTDTSAFKDSYVNGIIKYEKKDFDRVDEEAKIYGLHIRRTDLRGEEKAFAADTLYKLQIRFYKGDIQSEWSTVCLILGIDKPTVVLKGLDVQTATSDANFVTEISQTLDIIGHVSFNEQSDKKIEKEYLSQWHAIISDENGQKIYDTGNIYTTTFANPNDINYTIPYNLPLNKNYVMNITFTTNNGYIWSKIYRFKVIESPIAPLDANVVIDPKVDYGAFDVVLNMIGAYNGNITIRRSSSKNNFSTWEDVYTDKVKLKANQTVRIFNDTTIESGIWYKYQIQKRNVRGDRGQAIESAEAKMLVFDNVFLFDGKKQLCLRFNTSVNSMNLNVSDSKSDMIGSKYPYVKRNAAINYRSFPLSGTISFLSDIIYLDGESVKNSILNVDSLERDLIEIPKESSIFYDREAELGSSVVSMYDQYNLENNIGYLDDIIMEKEFREKVIEFLNNGKVKLFRSATEGNILVRLMNVSLIPNETLGRRIYDFSAEAVEIDDSTFATLDKYNIYDIGTYNTSVITTYEKLGQLAAGSTNATVDVIELIREKINNIETGEYKLNYVGVKTLRLIFNSQPYPVKINDDGTLSKDYSSGDIIGYIIKVNGKDTFVNRNGVYVLEDDGIDLTSVEVVDAACQVDYLCKVNEIENVTLPKTTYTITKIGQLRNQFIPNTDLINTIVTKHKITNPTFQQEVSSVFCLRLEANEGTLISIKTNDTKEEHDFIFSDTESLNFNNKEVKIESCVTKGIVLKRTDSLMPKVNQFYIDTNNIFSQDNMLDPQERYVYSFKGDDASSAYLQLYQNGLEENIYLKLEEKMQDGTPRLYTEDGEYYYLVLEKGKDYIYYKGAFRDYTLIDKDTILIEMETDILVDYGAILYGKEF